MSAIIDIIRRVVRQELAALRLGQLAEVTRVAAHSSDDDEHNYAATVRLKHEDIELRAVPMAVPCAGFAAPPAEGDLVLVQFVEGDLGQPLITGRFYHDGRRPPLHAQRQLLIEQETEGGVNRLLLAGDGSIIICCGASPDDPASKGNAAIELRKDGTIGITGDVTITGDLTVRAGDTGPSTTISGHTIQGS